MLTLQILTLISSSAFLVFILRFETINVFTLLYLILLPICAPLPITFWRKGINHLYTIESGFESSVCPKIALCAHNHFEAR